MTQVSNTAKGKAEALLFAKVDRTNEPGGTIEYLLCRPDEEGGNLVLTEKEYIEMTSPKTKKRGFWTWLRYLLMRAKTR